MRRSKNGLMTMKNIESCRVRKRKHSQNGYSHTGKTQSQKGCVLFVVHISSDKCNSPGKTLCKINIRTGSWDTYSKLNLGKKHLSGCSFGLLWLRKLAKVVEKDLERKRNIIWHAFTKIKENKRK